jgi:hypothetical protein
MHPGMEEKWFEPFAPPVDQKTLSGTRNPKTVAIYYKSPPYNYYVDPADAGAELIRLTTILHERLGYNFLVSTASDTFYETATILRKHFEKMPNSRFCLYGNHSYDVNARFLEAAFAGAHAIVSTDDTVTTLSDAVSTSKPVFLHTLSMRRKLLRAGEERSDNHNHQLQLALLRQNRLQLLSEKAIRSDWKPCFNDDWRDICAQIAPIALSRLAHLRPS